MNQSENINELVAALSKAQGKMNPAKFNKTNPHFKNKYADFTSCMEACRTPLSENGLSVMQYCENVHEKMMVVTMLAHSSGQWIKSYLPLKGGSTCQALGSELTYMKRYGLSALLGIVADEDMQLDDDGEEATKTNHEANRAPAVPFEEKKLITAKQVQLLASKLDKCTPDFRANFFVVLQKKFGVSQLETVPFVGVQDCLKMCDDHLAFLTAKRGE